MSLQKYSIILIILCIGMLLLPACSTRLMKADIKLEQEDYNEAIALYQDYIKDHPDKFRVRSRIGFAYLKTGKIDQSINEFRTVLNKEAGDPYSILYMGLAYLNKGEFDKAISTWQRYRNENQPIVETEINRLMTLLNISRSQKEAEKALAHENELMAAVPDSDTVAVCYYQDLSPDKSLSPFQKGLAAMVITDLSKVNKLKVVERMKMQELFKELELGQTGIVNHSTAPRVGKLLGAENLIIGNLSPGSIQVTTTVSSSSQGSIKASVSTSVEKEKFYELPGVIVKNIVKAMNIELTPEELDVIGVPQTKNYEAFVYFGRALDAMDSGNWKLAKDLFDKALEEDPQFGMAKNGRDTCPEIFMPDIGELKNSAPEQLSMKFEKAVESALSMQMETNELIAPEPYSHEEEIKEDKADLPDIVKTDTKKEVDDIREIVDEPLKKIPSSPKPAVRPTGSFGSGI